MLKQLIQRLLDSRTTPEEAAHSAMPSDKYSRLVDNGTIGSEWTDQAFSGIAAYDGYLFFTGTSTSAVPIIGIATAGYASNLTFPWEGARLATTIPIAKGQTWTVQGSSMKDVIIYLSKTVSLGGGYNRLVWRALSCLRPSFNYLPKVFLRAKSHGFQNNPLLSSIKALTSLAQAPRISLVTSLRATAGQLLDATQIQSQLLKSKSRTGRWHLLPFLTETLRELGSVVTLKKGHRLSSCAVAEVQPIILFGSTKQVQTFNPLTGGALC
jgi:hypothetical protein